jgi:hypothetical protein
VGFSDVLDDRSPLMATEGIERIYFETHNWGRTAKFFQGLGFDVEFETDHGLGMLRCGDGPYVFVEDLPVDHALQLQILVPVSDAETCRPGPPVEVMKPFEETQELQVRDPDGRIWRLRAPPKVQQ